MLTAEVQSVIGLDPNTWQREEGWTAVYQ